MAKHDTPIVRFRLIRRFPSGAPTVIALVLAAAIAALDSISGSRVSFSLIYVPAVMTATWLGRRFHGGLVAGVAALQSLIAAGAETAAIHITDVWNAASRFGVLVLVAVMIDAFRTALVEQRRHATIDSLTGAMNRRSFRLIAERERMRAGRDGAPLSLAYFDLDDFKNVNDLHGHSTGDAVLTAFSDAVAESVRGTDLFARLGGDEFVLLLPDTDAREAVIVVDRVRRLLAETCRVQDRPLTTSVGLATYRFPPSTVDAIISGADDLMYQAKQRGGDTVVGMVFVGPWSSWSKTMAEAEPTLRAAIPLSLAE